MLWTISVVLIILWILGLGSGFEVGLSIHILFAAAVVLLVVSISQEAMINEKLKRVLRSHGSEPDRTFHQMKGMFKEIAGKLSDNTKLEASGTYEKNSGIVQERIGQVKKGLGK